MAYVVVRPGGRFEIRESVHTSRGPRARSLANFAVLTDEVLAVSAERATRPFDIQAILTSAGRAGAPVVAKSVPVRSGDRSEDTEASRRRFVASSKRMVQVVERPPRGDRSAPGPVLIDLLGFADAIVGSQPPRPFEPLAFPVLARLSEPPPDGTSAV
ncbi:MAG TPA: hypothetical protein VG412_13605 [Acidimicrobiales bacterium]|nr:hypothetical protein [Acidimicrobiales bacterium]